MRTFIVGWFVQQTTTGSTLTEHAPKENRTVECRSTVLKKHQGLITEIWATLFLHRCLHLILFQGKHLKKEQTNALQISPQLWCFMDVCCFRRAIILNISQVQCLQSQISASLSSKLPRFRVVPCLIDAFASCFYCSSQAYSHIEIFFKDSQHRQPTN